MKRVLIATGVAVVLAAASFSMPAGAQLNDRGHGGSKGAPAARGAPPTGNAGAAIRGGGGGGPAFRGVPQAGRQAMPNRGAMNVPQGSTQFRGGHPDHRRQFRHGPGFAFGSGGPYVDYGYETYPSYSNDECLQMQRVWTDYGWRLVPVNVCVDQYQYQY